LVCCDRVKLTLCTFVCRVSVSVMSCCVRAARFSALKCSKLVSALTGQRSLSIACQAGPVLALFEIGLAQVERGVKVAERFGARDELVDLLRDV
jgi:hypothetical protein